MKYSTAHLKPCDFSPRINTNLNEYTKFAMNDINDRTNIPHRFFANSAIDIRHISLPRLAIVRRIRSGEVGGFAVGKSMTSREFACLPATN